MSRVNIGFLMRPLKSMYNVYVRTTHVWILKGSEEIQYTLEAWGCVKKAKTHLLWFHHLHISGKTDNLQIMWGQPM